MLDIKIVGVGGGAIRALNHIIDEGLEVDTLGIDRDPQSILLSRAAKNMKVGTAVGFGQGKWLTENERNTLIDMLRRADLVILVACLGGTTTGIVEELVNVVREVGVMPAVLVSVPFSFEGRVRASRAADVLERLKRRGEFIVEIDNESALKMMDKKMTLNQAYEFNNHLLFEAIRTLIENDSKLGLINRNAYEIMNFIRDGGIGHLGLGTGEDVLTAVREAFACPLLKGRAGGAERLLVSITGDPELSDVESALQMMEESTADGAEIVFNLFQETPSSGIKISLIAAGLLS